MSPVVAGIPPSPILMHQDTLVTERIVSLVLPITKDHLDRNYKLANGNGVWRIEEFLLPQPCAGQFKGGVRHVADTYIHSSILDVRSMSCRFFKKRSR
jgi:hypothetical protein